MEVTGVAMPDVRPAATKAAPAVMARPNTEGATWLRNPEMKFFNVFIVLPPAYPTLSGEYSIKTCRLERFFLG